VRINQAENFVFSSAKKEGTQPLWPNTALEKHINLLLFGLG
jgi:hypothetical protein